MFTYVLAVGSIGMDAFALGAVAEGAVAVRSAAYLLHCLVLELRGLL